MWSETAKLTTTKHILEKLRTWFLVLNFLMCMFVVAFCLFLREWVVCCFVSKSKEHLDLLMEKRTARQHTVSQSVITGRSTNVLNTPFSGLSLPLM